MGLCWPTGLGTLPLPQGHLRQDPQSAAGAQLSYPHQHWDLWCRGKAGLGEPRAPCRSRSSPPRPRACRPRGTASRSPSEEEEAEEEAPPPWRARHPGGLGRTHGGSLACAGPAGRRPPCAPALGALPSAALPFNLGARRGRAVAEPGPHQDPLVRQHGQRAGASGRRRHRAPCGAPGPRRGHASGHRAQVRSYGEQGAPPRPGPAAPRAGSGMGAEGGEQAVRPRVSAPHPSARCCNCNGHLSCCCCCCCCEGRPPELSRPSSAWRSQYPPCRSQVISVPRETPMRPAFGALSTATFTRFPTRSSLHIYSKPHGYEFCAV